MPVIYLFPTWAERTLGTRRPAAVARYFRERGFEQSREGWRKLLSSEPKSISIATWATICEITGQPLSSFIDYAPTGRATLKRKVERAGRPSARQPLQPAPVPPPALSDFYGDRS